MSNPRAFAACLPALLLVGCSSNRSIEVHTYWGMTVRSLQPGATFSWLPEKRVDDQSQSVAYRDVVELIRTSIETQFSEAGYVHDAFGTAPVFWVNQRLGRQVAQATTGHESWDVGAVVIEVLVPPNGDLVWRGWAESRIDYSHPPDVRKERVEYAVRQILKPFLQAQASSRK